MNEQDALAALDARVRFGMKPGLDAIRGMLAAMGNPERSLKVVHVAGTNGKGSVAAMIASALQAAGHRTGLYTSPHLVRFHERIRIAGDDVTGDALARAMSKVPLDAFPEATYFEVATALAFQAFVDAGVKVGVLEAGLGGRLDATNVIERPLVTVITNVALDHVDVLGKTEEEIAREKAGILREGVPLVTGATGGPLLEFRKIAKGPVRTLGDDFVPLPLGPRRMEVHGLRDHGEVEIPLAGAHQLENAALALAALDEVDKAGVPVSVDAARRGLARTRWPGRLDRRGNLLLDGAHNPAGMVALAQHLEAEGLKPVVVFGALADKDWATMVEILVPRVRDAIVTRVPSPRALEPMEAARMFSRLGVMGMVVEDAGHALRTAEGIAGKDGVVLVTGSLYLVGDVLSRL